MKDHSTRRPILPSNWTAKDRRHTKFLQGGNDVEYLGKNDKWVPDEVVTNDCFRGEGVLSKVMLRNKGWIHYKLLRKNPDKIDESIVLELPSAASDPEPCCFAESEFQMHLVWHQKRSKPPIKKAPKDSAINEKGMPENSLPFYELKAQERIYMDFCKGMFMVRREFSGVSRPIHCQHSTYAAPSTDGISACELNE
ncbi:hypothetical protein OS493_018466 [Desmophyllum pertusum]|uniref:Uncharacterized protein n=1 Tax=Desmophyllum pertusum TaxID=174260 RepID=A0A9X0D9F7_9CNID|nr:hypothetical protein OS493_018466 [Desmophyllum pertusum]